MGRKAKSCDTREGFWALLEQKKQCPTMEILVPDGREDARFTSSCVTSGSNQRTDCNPEDLSELTMPSLKVSHVVSVTLTKLTLPETDLETKEVKGDLFCHQLLCPLHKVKMTRHLKQSITCILKSVQLAQQRPV
jgi:hypothetical protein